MNRWEILKGAQAVVKNTWDHVFLKNVQYEEGSDAVVKNPYKKSDLVYICISTTAKAIAQVPIIVEAENSRGDRKPVGKTDPWQKVFDRPNIYLDRYSFTEAMIGYLLLDGNTWIVPFPPGKYPPDSMWLIKKKNIRPIRDPKTGHLVGWAYNPMDPNFGNIANTSVFPKEAMMLAPEDVIHVWFWNPDDMIMGMPPLEAGQMNLVTDYRAARYNQIFFEKGAVPGGVVWTSQKLHQKQFERLKAQIDEEHTGYRRGHRIMILEQGLQYTQTGLTQKDMEFIKLRKLNAERIFQIFGMKKSIVSVMEDINYSTAREERIEWWEGTNFPMMNMIASAFNCNLFEHSPSLSMRYDTYSVPVLQDNLKGRLESARILSTIGFTGNEINERLNLGFQKKAWRNVWYMPVNLVPVTPDGTPQLPNNNPEPDPNLVEEDPKPPKMLVAGKSRQENIWNGLMALVTPFERMFSSKVSRVVFDMRKRALDLLFKQKQIKSPDDVEGELFSQDTSNLEKFVTPIYYQVVAEGVENFSTEIGVSIGFDLAVDPVAIQFLAMKRMKIRNLTNTVIQAIRQEVTDGLQGGLSTEQIAERLREVFDIASKRATVIARTEIMSALNFARSESINRSGFREKEWFTAMDERVRASHVAMHGKKVKVGEPWVLPGGITMQYPGDPNGPAKEVVNCRCIELVSGEPQI